MAFFASRPWVPMVAAILVVAGVAGALVVRSDVAVAPASKAPPVTLAAGPSGTTTLGASATSAVTTASMPLAGTISPLKVHRVSGDWAVSLSLVSATGFSVLESVSVQLAGGGSQSQVVVSLGTVTQASGMPMALGSGDLTVTANGGAGVTGVLVMQVRLVPAGQAAPVMAYSYRLTLA